MSAPSLPTHGQLALARTMQQIFSPMQAYIVQFEKNGLIQYSRPVYGQNDQIVRLKAGFVCDRVISVRPVLESEGPVEVRFQ